MQTNPTYDYIIVGAGSAGCILANRLSASPENTVLLIEAGGSDRNPMISMPSALSYPMNTKRYNWGYYSEPEPFINNRRIHTARGKGLGGSSSINGMVYVRGHACDFDEWVELGAHGWSYQECLPYFKRLESWLGGEDQYRGATGEVGVSYGNHMTLNPLYQTFIDAGEQAGYGTTTDYNGYRQEGFGPMQMNVSNGLRQSSSRVFLRTIESRKNLTILSNTQAKKILFEGKRARGLLAHRKNNTIQLNANKEIILSCGTIGSPQLLELSGIGSPKHLQALGIDPLIELPGVGENLQDHLEVFFQYECTKRVSLNRQLGLLSKGLIGARWLFFKSGLGSTNHFESCAFIRSDAGKKWPDIQYHFLPAAVSYDGNVAFKGDGYQVHVGPNKPKSRGHSHIRSPDFYHHPSIQYNYLKHQDDIEDWRKVIRLTREILTQPAFDEYRGAEIQPGANINSEQEIDQWLRENVETAYHPSGTCRMGDVDDVNTVVDSNCKVVGSSNLRVVDSSIFPSIPNGNLNAPTMMVAEKAADIILAKSPLPQVDADVWTAPHWQQKQREHE